MRFYRRSYYLGGTMTEPVESPASETYLPEEEASWPEWVSSFLGTGVKILMVGFLFGIGLNWAFMAQEPAKFGDLATRFDYSMSPKSTPSDTVLVAMEEAEQRGPVGLPTSWQERNELVSATRTKNGAGWTLKFNTFEGEENYKTYVIFDDYDSVVDLTVGEYYEVFKYDGSRRLRILNQ